MKKVTLKVSDMNCTSCAMLIDGDLEDVDGVKSASTSYAKAQTQVEFDEGKVDEKKIIETVAKTGYTATLEG